MSESPAENIKKYLRNVVGDKPICGTRSAKNRRHVRLFVAGELDDIVEVTPAVASLCKLRMTKNMEYIVFGGGGSNPVQEVANSYALAMGEESHPFIDMK